MMTTFQYGIDNLTIGIAVDICNGKIKAKLTSAAIQQIKKSKKVVDNIIEQDKTAYGINTGFGPLCTTIISDNETKELQKNLLLSHSVGVGDPTPVDIAKLMLILKVHSLAKGYSGISVPTIERIIWHIDNDIIPIVPSQGSVGASGDLAPLSHLFLPLIGYGKVYYKGDELSTPELYKKLHIKAIELGPKEGLALINGTQYMAAYAIKIADMMQNCLDNADIIAALNLEAMLGSVKTFDKRIHELRPYKGSQYVAERFRLFTQNSQIVESHKNCSRVQDPYSLRCIPQVHGAARDAWLHVKNTLLIELNSVTDNPLIFNEDEALSGGNFHGEPIAIPVDYLAVAASELGNIADRRIYLSLMDKIEGLPKLLMKETGLNSGFMIPQYTTAALVSENKSLCYPSSADSIPTSLGQEDHVSMGSISVRKAMQVTKNLEKILGIELFCAAQAFDFREPLKSGIIINEVHRYVRSKIPHVDKDVLLHELIDIAIDIVKNKEIVSLVNDIATNKDLPIKNEKHEVFGIY